MRVYPLADSNVTTYITEYFVPQDTPFVPMTGVWGNSDFANRDLPQGVGYAIEPHKLIRSKGSYALCNNTPIGTIKQWMGGTYSDQPVVTDADCYPCNQNRSLSFVPRMIGTTKLPEQKVTGNTPTSIRMPFKVFPINSATPYIGTGSLVTNSTPSTTFGFDWEYVPEWPCLLLAYIQCDENVTLSMPSGWQTAASVTNTNGDKFFCVYQPNATSHSSDTFTLSSTCNVAALFFSVNGLILNTIDQITSGNGSGTSITLPTSGTTSTYNELAVVGDGHVPFSSGGVGYSNYFGSLLSGEQSSELYISSATRVLTSTTAVPFAASTSNTTIWSAIMVTCV